VSAPPFLDAAAIAGALPPAAAVDALEAALRGGLDPEADPPRAIVSAGAGELLVMPSAAAGAVGVKLASVAPGNPARGLPRIQGIYVLFDPETLAPRVLLDGIALTTLRTSAVSALAVRHLAAPDARRLLVFGTGPQARVHVEALRAVRPVESVRVAAREPAKAAAFADELAAAGLDAAPAGEDAVGRADLICCATTARAPLFDGVRVAPHATVVAIGSHEPGARETDDALAAAAAVVVESRASALREAGDVIAAIAAGALHAQDLLTLAGVVRGEQAIDPGRPRLFKSTGMAWEDAVVAATVHRRWCGAS